jgi:glycosyltransferase involved in cell wall biosynthesis
MACRNARERTSLIVTVLDELSTIDALLESVAQQTCAPDEIVVSDGGSTDGTREALERWMGRLPLRVIDAPGANIARGRNLAIEAAIGELIAVTDAGVRLAPEWLAQLHLALTPEIDAVSGFFEADPQTPFERALGATTLPSVEDVKARSFLPSSRSVLFRREAWRRVGGYPEWLDYCEDLVFDLALRRAGCQFAFAPRAIALFRPRRSMLAFFRQYFLYARGDGKAGLWARRHAVRYATYIVAAAALWRRSPAAWLLPLGVAAYMWLPYQRLGLDGVPAYALALPPAIRLVGDIAKMLGYPVGVWWRMCRAWTFRSSS